MALHQAIQRLLLIGARLESFPHVPPPKKPARLAPLFEAVESAHRTFDQRALDYGDRYRSGFWVIYLLSAVAVLCAVLPLALGWDSPSHMFHPYARVWAICEVVIIAVVLLIYWLGHRSDWQGEWLRARTTAELTSYLPMLAPILDFNAPAHEPNWYVRLFDPGQHLRTADDVSVLCAQLEPEARKLLTDAWLDPEFVREYIQWTVDTLEGQRRYHARVSAKQHALLHRIHRINGTLFGLTALAALMHLFIHQLWLSLVTTFFPALGASLHGAMAQAETYRLAATSERLARDLGDSIARIQHSMSMLTGNPAAAVKGSIEGALALILEEHQDWNLLVRPHHLPLA
jgi:hypothetical protein